MCHDSCTERETPWFAPDTSFPLSLDISNSVTAELQQSISLTCSWIVVLERKLALLLRGVLKWPTWVTSNSWKLLVLQVDQGRLEPYPRMLSLQILLQLWFHPLTLTEGRSDLFSPLSSTQSHFILQALHLSNHISLTLVQPENKSHNTC